MALNDLLGRLFARSDPPTPADGTRLDDGKVRALLDGVSIARWECDPDGRLLSISGSWSEHTGQPTREAAGLGWLRMAHPADRPGLAAAWDQAVRGADRFEHEYRLAHGPSGGWRWACVRAVRLRGANGQPAGWIALLLDVDDRRRSEDEDRARLAEPQHRVRNTLAVIRSIVRRTGSNSRSVEEFGESLQGRLGAYARIQAMLSRDPGRAVRLRELVEDELLAHAVREGERVRVDGPDIPLDARSAESLSLAIHELASNAVKHGVLGDTEGRLAVRWSVTGSTLHFAWVEDGRPIEPPGPPGFGSELLLQSLPYEVRAETSLEFGPDGMRFTLAMPLQPSTSGALPAADRT